MKKREWLTVFVLLLIIVGSVGPLIAPEANKRLEDALLPYICVGLALVFLALLVSSTAHRVQLWRTQHMTAIRTPIKYLIFFLVFAYGAGRGELPWWAILLAAIGEDKLPAQSPNHQNQSEGDGPEKSCEQ